MFVFLRKTGNNWGFFSPENVSMHKNNLDLLAVNKCATVSSNIRYGNLMFYRVFPLLHRGYI